LILLLSIFGVDHQALVNFWSVTFIQSWLISFLFQCIVTIVVILCDFHLLFLFQQDDPPLPALAEDLEPHQLLTRVEDRHNVCLDLQRAQDEIVQQKEAMPPAMTAAQNQPKEAKPVQTRRKAEGSAFSKVAAAVSKEKCFDQGDSDSFDGDMASMQRMRFLFGPMKDFIKKVQLAQGFLRGAQQLPGCSLLPS
jgi:hypothetical protein